MSTSPSVFTYEWKITDPTMMEQIKAAEVGQAFESAHFEYANIKWYLGMIFYLKYTPSYSL